MLLPWYGVVSDNLFHQQPYILDLPNRMYWQIVPSALTFVGIWGVKFAIEHKTLTKKGPQNFDATRQLLMLIGGVGSSAFFLWFLQKWAPTRHLNNVVTHVDKLKQHRLLKKIILTAVEKNDEEFLTQKMIKHIKLACPAGWFNGVEIQRNFNDLYAQIAYLKQLLNRLVSTYDLRSPDHQEIITQLAADLDIIFDKLSILNAAIRNEQSDDYVKQKCLNDECERQQESTLYRFLFGSTLQSRRLGLVVCGVVFFVLYKLFCADRSTTSNVIHNIPSMLQLQIGEIPPLPQFSF